MNTTDEYIWTIKHANDGTEISSYMPNPDYVKPISFWQKIKNFITIHNVHPYITTKDLNNSSNNVNENKPKNATEIGISIDF